MPFDVNHGFDYPKIFDFHPGLKVATAAKSDFFACQENRKEKW